MYVIQADIKYGNEDKPTIRYAGIDQFLCRPAWHEEINDNPKILGARRYSCTTPRGN